MCFLDEKWFYTTSWHKKIKNLPQQKSESVGPTYKKGKIRCRRFPVKVMYMGVVACPNEERNFEGKILLKRVSERVKLSRATFNKDFLFDVLVNEAIKQQDWKGYITDDMMVGELKDLIGTNYDLDEVVTDRLEFCYWSFRGNQKSRKMLENQQMLQTLGNRIDENGQAVPISLDNDVQLFVSMKQGEEVDKDCSCDSAFMEKVMPEVAHEMRRAYHWIPETDKLYLVMDNAGGHGTDNSKSRYTEVMRKGNIEIIWQVPRSPETNMLDLGCWMSIQSVVHKIHYMKRCNHEALAKSVEDAWNTYLSPTAFKNVYNRLQVVLQCILKDNGGNQLVEKRRGKLFRDATIVDLIIDNENDNNMDVIVNNSIVLDYEESVVESISSL